MFFCLRAQQRQRCYFISTAGNGVFSVYFAIFLGSWHRHAARRGVEYLPVVVEAL
jgi:hypothetical protein